MTSYQCYHDSWGISNLRTDKFVANLSQERQFVYFQHTSGSQPNSGFTQTKQKIRRHEMTILFAVQMGRNDQSRLTMTNEMTNLDFSTTAVIGKQFLLPCSPMFPHVHCPMMRLQGGHFLLSSFDSFDIEGV